MSEMILLLLVSPLLALIMVFGGVTAIALCQARPEDIPAILRECSAVFRRLADHLPTVRSGDLRPSRMISPKADEQQEETTQADEQQEETTQADKPQEKATQADEQQEEVLP
jgi:hypothetical protein